MVCLSPYYTVFVA